MRWSRRVHAADLATGSTTRLLVAIRLPDVNVSVVGPVESIAQLGAQAVELERTRLMAFTEAFVEALIAGLEGDGVQVLSETDVGAAPLPSGTRLVRVDVTDMPSVTNPRTGAMMGCILFGSITGGLGYLACTHARNEITQTAELEVRLFEVSGLLAERIERGGEFVRVVDTSDLTPITVQRATATVTSGHHIMRAPSGQSAVDFARAQGHRLGQLAYEEIAAQLSRGLSSAVTPPRVIEQPPAIEPVQPLAPSSPTQQPEHDVFTPPS